jgi:Glycosyl transferase family 90
MLQEWEYQEWYTKYLIPHVHYIPLANDLSNLNSAMHWIVNHA